MKPKIIIIIPYFGSWPSYLDLFLKGCENNQWLDILFFTDCRIPKTKSLKNIKYIYFTLTDFSNLASQKIGEVLKIKMPYKLCDFRPCYGLIFKDYIKNYDYWGYGDIDLIYGNLSAFIFPKIDKGYDVISNRKEILSGSLAIFKNTTYINHLYKNSERFLELIKSTRYEGLDETAHDHSTWRGGSKLALPKHCFTYIVANEQEKGTLKVSFENTCQELIGKNDILEYLSPKLIFNGNAIGYYHYVCNKNREEFKFPNWKYIPDRFYVSNTGFYQNSPTLFDCFVHCKRMTIGFAQNIGIRIIKRLKNWI